LNLPRGQWIKIKIEAPEKAKRQKRKKTERLKNIRPKTYKTKCIGEGPDLIN
jgi:hypothetical protein